LIAVTSPQLHYYSGGFMALKLLANNNAKSVLASGISASATVITVSSGTGGLFPQPVSGQSYFKLTIVDAATKLITEIMHVTSVSGDVMTVQRGQEGTAARVWSTNDIVANMLTAGSFLSCLQIANNFSEIAAEGSEAVRQALLNLGSSDGTINGRLMGVPRVVTSSGMFTKHLAQQNGGLEFWGPGAVVLLRRRPVLVRFRLAMAAGLAHTPREFMTYPH
jgi:hypothetical protein